MFATVNSGPLLQMTPQPGLLAVQATAVNIDIATNSCLGAIKQHVAVTLVTMID